MNVLKPRQPVPELELATLAGRWSLSASTPELFTMIVFYRGLHCPVCKSYLRELNRLHDDFEKLGVASIAASTDSEERARRAADEWGLDNVTIGYGVSTAQSRDFGLHRSAGRGLTSIGIEEPAEFSEPGLFLVRPDDTLYWSSVSTMPFARPNFKEILSAVAFAKEKDYPARGELS
ncbi:MAG: AhpC/TSA family protein [Proteobacteria bacterium]|nr:MAG: AhpC/TSA family protein [Pseudomonadota bacterium]